MRHDCKEKTPKNIDCCAVHTLQVQPDFMEQKTALMLAIEWRHHICELYPKYHCECNFIERFWGAAKRTARYECDYSFKALLERIPHILDDISLDVIRHSVGRHGYITSYANGLDAHEAERAEKQFESHRRIRKDD